MLISYTTSSDSHRKHSCCPIVQEILDLINHGAAQIVDKQYKQAGISLTRALQMNKDVLVLETKHEKSHCKDDALSSSACLCGQLLDLVIATSDWCENIVDIELTKAKYGYCWLTSRRSMYAQSSPLVLTPSDKVFDLVGKIPMQDFQLTLSLIIIFNLALCQHLYGIGELKRGISCSSILIRASSLYGLSYTLLHQLNIETCWFLGLAIVNNEAQVLSIVGKHQEAEELLQVILSGLCCLNQCIGNKNDEGSFLFLPQSFLDGLVHNTSHLILKQVATASAA